MKTPDPQNSTPNERDDEEFCAQDYDEFTMLERLETLREDMEDLGVTNLSELIERIEKLHRSLDG
jgi:hypothetical protein